MDIKPNQTPGPWNVVCTPHGLSIDADHPKFPGCRLHVGTVDHLNSANAELMAAAPDLLLALKNLLAAYESNMHSEFDYPGDPWSAEGRDDAEALAACAAIALAMGK